jgi:uncharacterized protein (DUF433 family)
VLRFETPHPQDVSFLQLVELAAIGGLRKQGFSLGEVRRIVSYCEDQLATPYALASLKFKFGGHDVFVDKGSYLLSVLRGQGAQAWDEILGPFLQNLEYDAGFARRWWPHGQAAAVVIDPDFGFGLPVVAGSGVRTEILRERLESGDSPAQVADDFNLSKGQVAQARVYEHTRHSV